MDAAKSARWRARHPERALATSRKHETENREKRRAQDRAEYARDRHSSRILWKGKILSWRNQGRRLLLIQERGGRCVDCGFDNPLALQFDHRDPSQKKDIINAIYNLNAKRAEAYKCDIRCANCHSIKTYYSHRRRGMLWQ